MLAWSFPGRARGFDFFPRADSSSRNLKPASVRLLTSPPLSSPRPRRWRAGETRGLHGGLLCGMSPSHARPPRLSPPQSGRLGLPLALFVGRNNPTPWRDSVCQGGIRLSFARQNPIGRSTDRKSVGPPVAGSFRKRSKRRFFFFSVRVLRVRVRFRERRLTRLRSALFFLSRVERRRRTTILRADPPPRTARVRIARMANASPTTAATSGTRARARGRTTASTRLPRRAPPAGIRRRRRGCGTSPPAAGRADRGRATTGSPGGSRRRRPRQRRLWRRPCRAGRRRRRRRERPRAGTRRRLRRTCG